MFFCHEGESHSLFIKHLLTLLEGDARCKYCQHNGRDKCPHRAINSDKEVRRKGVRLLDLILQDQRRRGGVEDLTFSELFDEGELDCFEKYNDDGSKEMVKVDV